MKKEEIQAIRYVATGAEIPVSTSWVHSDYPTMAFADLGEDPVLPDGVDTVIDVILEKERVKHQPQVSERVSVADFLRGRKFR